jgi:guanylate kinase
MAILFVLSAPSGAGKSTLARRIVETTEGLTFSVSHTTRPARPGEQDGRDYHFVPEIGFREMVAADEFLEWAPVHGYLYGTAEAPARRILLTGQDLLLDIDVQGAAQVRRREPAAVSLFVLPPGYAPLRERLIARGTETPAELSRRLSRAREEAEGWSDYDYLIVNDDLNRAVEEIRSVIVAERRRAGRMQATAGEILRTFRAAARDEGGP